MNAETRMSPQMWAFLGSAAAGVSAVLLAVAGSATWAAVCVLAAIAAGVAARIWSRRGPAPMPHWMRGVLFLPRTFQSADRLRMMLQPRPGERVLEIGPGVGIHALPIAAALAPGGTLDALDVQPAMLADLRRRAVRAGIDNVRTEVGDARHLPYADHSFDGAYLISVLGEVPDDAAALRELRRVLKPGGRLVVGEIVIDPDFISMQTLQQRAAATGFGFDRRLGPRVAYFASFRTPAD